METPLLPKEMGKGPKMALLGGVVLIIIAVVVGIALCIFELGLREFETPWIAVGAIIFILLFMTILFYKFLRTDEDLDDPKFLYVLALQFFAIVIFGCTLYAVAFPPSVTPYYFIGGVTTGIKGTGGSITLQSTNEVIHISSAPCSPFHFKNKAAGGSSATIKLQDPSESMCSVSGGSGTITAAANKVRVSCDASWEIGGNVKGCKNDGMVMTLNGASLLIPAVQGETQTFTFKNRVKNGSKFTIAIKSQPSVQKCSSPVPAEGTALENVRNVEVQCIPALLKP